MQGEASGQANLGEVYEHGLGGIAKNDEEALKWHQLAAEQWDREGLFNLGNGYWKSNGGVKDPEKAAKLHRLAAEQGSIAAQYNLGLMYDLGNFCEVGWG